MDIEKAIANWEEVVSWIEDGWDCDDEYMNDVYARHKVFQWLESNKGTLSAELQKRLDEADARYRAATVDDWPFAVRENTSGLDRVRHWYWFRRPEEASMRKAWDNNPEFRAFVLACRKYCYS